MKMPQETKPAFSALNINILCGKHVDLDSRWYADDICSPYTRVYMVTGGEGTLRYGEETLTMTPGNIYIIPAGLRFSFSTAKTLSKAFFHISVITPGGYDLFERLDRCLMFPDAEAIKNITDELEAYSVKSILSVKAFLYELVCRCTDEMNDTQIAKISEPVMQALEYITKNPRASLTAEDIAEALFVSPAKLRKIFSTEVGTPIGQYITNHVLIRSEESLRTSNLTIKEISDALDFCDRYYFSRCFAKKFGLPPAEYRKKVRT